MIKTLFAKSGLATALTSEQLYFVTDAANKGALLGIYADETNDQVKLYFKDIDNTGNANEVLTLDSTAGKAATAAEEIIAAINGLAKNAQVVKVTNGNNHENIDGIDGVDIPAFTITNTDISIGGGAVTGFRFTLGSATVGCTFTATLTKDDESATETVTGTIATATDTIDFAVGDFTAGAATITVTLTNPNQPNVTQQTSQAATIAS